MTRETGATLSAELQRATAAFAALYERQAYRVYNLALRITCDPRAALIAAREAFLLAHAHREGERAVVAAAVAAAVRAAPCAPRPQGAGAGEAAALLRATAALTPTERAVLAVEQLAPGGPAECGPALGIDEQAVAALHERALAGLAAALRRVEPAADEASARERLAGWLWAEPPVELWEELYPRFYAAEQERRRASGGDRRPARTRRGRLAALPGGGGAGRGHRSPLAARLRVSRRRLVNTAALGLVVALSIAMASDAGDLRASATQAIGLGGGDAAPAEVVPASLAPPRRAAPSSPTAPSAPVAGGGERARTDAPLTPAELDRLRLQELRDLRRLGERQADRRLSAAQRAAAGADRRELIARIRRRLAAAEARARALTRELGRERAARRRAERGRDRAAAERERERRAGDGGGAGEQDGEDREPRRDRAGRREGAEEPTARVPGSDAAEDAVPEDDASADRRECLLEESTGTYVCPQ